MRIGTVLALVLASCNGGKDTTDTGGADAATFTEVKETVLQPTCMLSTCHSGTPSSGQFVFPPGGEHGAIVNVPSADVAGEILVIPGDSAGSYLMLKMTDAVGIANDPMPPPFGMSDPTMVDLVASWIDGGALDN